MSNIFLVLVVNFFIVLFFTWQLANATESIQGVPSRLLIAIPILSITDALFQLNTTILRNQGRALLYSIFQISSTGLNLALTIVMVAILNLNWEGRVSGWTVESILLAIASVFYIYRSGYFIFKINKKYLKEILQISLPMIPNALAATVIGMSDRLFISRMLGNEAVGVYSLGYQFGMIILLVTEAFNLVWTPWMYRQLSKIDETRKTQIVQLTYLYNFFVILLALFVALISDPLIRILTTHRYHDAPQYVLMVALSYAVRGMYQMVFSYLVHEGKTGFLALIAVIAAIVNIIANYILISINGAIGGAQATLLSFAIMYLGTWWYSNRIYPMPWLLGWNSPKKPRGAL